MTRRRQAVIAGGGTGGHVVPSLQIARALVTLGNDPASIELFGSRRGQEATDWPPLEFPFTLLPGRGIRRSLRPAALWDNAGAVLGLVWATLRSVGSFVANRPSTSSTVHVARAAELSATPHGSTRLSSEVTPVDAVFSTRFVSRTRAVSGGGKAYVV